MKKDLIVIVIVPCLHLSQVTATFELVQQSQQHLTEE